MITHDPQTGGRNVGMYRMQVIDRNTTFMHWQIHKDGRADWLATDGRIAVAVALGLDPITAYSRERAAAEAHRRVDAGRLPPRRAGRARQGRHRRPRGSRARRDRARGLHRAATRSATEGPFGDHTGYYTAAEPFPVFHVTAMTMRRDAIYPSIVVGKPPQEDAWLGKATERIFLPAMRTTAAGDRRLRPAGRGRLPQLLHRLDQKSFPGHAQKVMHAIWGLGMLSLTKCVVVVDAHVDVHDYEQVIFYAGANVDPKRDVIALRRPARPSRPRARAPVLRRQARHRRHREVAGGGRAARGPRRSR